MTAYVPGTTPTTAPQHQKEAYTLTPEELLLQTTPGTPIRPTEAQTNHFLISTYHHSLTHHRIHDKLPQNIKDKDNQHPHDLAGTYTFPNKKTWETHKLDWHVFKGLALFTHTTKEHLPTRIQNTIQQSLNIHRLQDHHRTDRYKNNTSGALDALNSALENRGYQAHTTDIGNITIDTLEHWLENTLDPELREAARLVLPTMKEVITTTGLENLNGYTTIDGTPNPGIPHTLFNNINDRIQRFREQLGKLGYNIYV